MPSLVYTARSMTGDVGSLILEPPKRFCEAVVGCCNEGMRRPVRGVEGMPGFFEEVAAELGSVP